MSRPVPTVTVPLRWAGRASWSGFLAVGTLTLPVQAYPRLASRPVVDLHSLHAGCGQRIRLQKRCPVHGDVTDQQIVKGLAQAPEHYVTLTDQELTQLRPAADPVLRCAAFFPPQDFDLALLAGRSYLLLPHGPAGQRPYAALAEVLRTEEVWTLGKGVLFGRSHAVVVRPTVPGLVLELLHDPLTVRPATDLLLSQVTLDPAEVEALCQLIRQRDPVIPWAEYRDPTAERLTAWLQQRRAPATPAAATGSNGAPARRPRVPAARRVPARARRPATARGARA